MTKEGRSQFSRRELPLLGVATALAFAAAEWADNPDRGPRREARTGVGWVPLERPSARKTRAATGSAGPEEAIESARRPSRLDRLRRIERAPAPKHNRELRSIRASMEGGTELLVAYARAALAVSGKLRDTAEHPGLGTPRKWIQYTAFAAAADALSDPSATPGHWEALAEALERIAYEHRWFANPRAHLRQAVHDALRRGHPSTTMLRMAAIVGNHTTAEACRRWLQLTPERPEDTERRALARAVVRRCS